MIKFELQYGDDAIVYNSVGSEDGWVFSYDRQSKQFLIWDSVERHSTHQSPEKCDTLEEVCKLVQSWT